MRMSEDVKINITAETAGVEGQLNGTAAGVTAVGATSKAAAPAVRGLAGTIDTLRLSLTTLQKAFGLLGIITLTISWLTALWGVCKKAYEWFNKLGEASPSLAIDRMGDSAKSAAAEWKKLNEEMERNAAQRKAIADDAQKQADATLGLDLANIEAKLQTDLDATTDPSEREDLTAAADAAKTARTNKASVDAARAARANAQAELIANQKDIDRTLKVAESSSSPTLMSPALQQTAEKQKARDAYDSAQKEIAKLDEEVSYLRINARNMGPRATAEAFARNQAEREKALNVPSVPDPSKDEPSEEYKAYVKSEDERKKRLAEAQAKAQKLVDERTRLQSTVKITDTRVAEAEQITRAGMTQAQREAADREIDKRIAEVEDYDAKNPAPKKTTREELDKIQDDALLKPAKQRIDADAKRTDVEKSVQEKIKAITVDAPIAASSAAAAGGFMGGSMNNAARLSEQREFKRDAIEREKVDLLSKINNKLDD
jgi:hypothetical protein